MKILKVNLEDEVLKMNEVSKVVLAVLTSVGGISGLLILAIKISVNTIAEKKY